MFIYYYGSLFRMIYPRFTWRRKNDKKNIFLTFDDGPVPEVTEWVLDLLAKEQIKATFFCVGENVVKNAAIYQRLQKEGHRVANHTFNHLNGRKNTDHTYFENVAKCTDVLNLPDERPLFRPPYGRLTKIQRKELLKKYEIVMWEVLSADFASKISAKTCLQKTEKYTKPGSIVLFHDSVKTFEKIQWVLPRYIQAMKRKGFQFAVL